MLTAVQRTGGHYEVQEVEFGRVYRWCPEHVDIYCECGERTNVTAASVATCPRCGANQAATIRAAPSAGSLEDQALHPWRYDASNLRDAGLPY
jgi:hypothetical protein